jgi:hypothetical protein
VQFKSSRGRQFVAGYWDDCLPRTSPNLSNRVAQIQEYFSKIAILGQKSLEDKELRQKDFSRFSAFLKIRKGVFLGNSKLGLLLWPDAYGYESGTSVIVTTTYSGIWTQWYNYF